MPFYYIVVSIFFSIIPTYPPKLLLQVLSVLVLLSLLNPKTQTPNPIMPKALSKLKSLPSDLTPPAESADEFPSGLVFPDPSGLKVLGFMVYGLGLRASGLGSRVQGLGQESLKVYVGTSGSSGRLGLRIQAFLVWSHSFNIIQA